MPLTVFFGVLTLAPLVMALALAGLGLARRATFGLALGLTLAGVVIPLIGLALLAPEVSAGFPLEIALLGDQTTWLALYGRADALSIYAAIGVAVIVAPLTLWLAWRAAPLDEAEEAEPVASEADEATEPVADQTDTTQAEDETAAPAPATAPRMLGRWQWSGVALALTLESLALWLCFAENIVLLGIVWAALVVVAWGLGELGSEKAILDLRGLSLMVVGPIVWLVTTLLIAGPAGARLLIDLTGASRLPTGHVFIISLALAFAAGAYPALAWLRKRASIATPAGLAAIALAVTPAALFVGARTFSIAQTTTMSWPSLNIGKPSVTVGIVLIALGALSVAVAGLLALGRRDPRSLLAALTLTQAGWGLVGLGVGAPMSQLGVTLLLATSVMGLGAVIAALVASGAITADVEPDSAGPRIFGEPLRPALMFAWLVGAASLIGAPLFAGFSPLQLITADTITGPRLNIPLVGLAWIGSALVAIGITRATAPAFTAPIVEAYDDDEDFPEDEIEADAADEEEQESVPQATAEAAAEDEQAEEETADTEEKAPVAASPELRLEELPAIALGALILIAGVAPGVALTLANAAATATLQAGALSGLVVASSSGYTAGPGQWFATAPAILVAIAILGLAYLRTRMPREIRPLYLAGQEAAAATEGAEEPAAELEELEEEEAPAELVALPEPSETWSDIRPALRSGWMTPGAAWLGLNGEEAASADETSDESSDEDTGEDETPHDAERLRSVGASSTEKTEETGDPA